MNKLFTIVLSFLFLLSTQVQASPLTRSEEICAKNANANQNILIANCLKSGAPAGDCEIDPVVRMNNIKKQCNLSVGGCRYWARMLAPALGIPAQDIDWLEAGCGSNGTMSGGDDDEEILGDYDIEELLGAKGGDGDEEDDIPDGTFG